MLNRSAFAVNASRRFAAITDGLSNTVVAAEVKALQPEFRSCFPDGSGGTLPTLSNPAVVPDPAKLDRGRRLGIAAMRPEDHGALDLGQRQQR